jgi:hypothetical protein
VKGRKVSRRTVPLDLQKRGWITSPRLPVPARVTFFLLFYADDSRAATRQCSAAASEARFLLRRSGLYGVLPACAARRPTQQPAANQPATLSLRRRDGACVHEMKAPQLALRTTGRIRTSRVYRGQQHTAIPQSAAANAKPYPVLHLALFLPSPPLSFSCSARRATQTIRATEPNSSRLCPFCC